MAFDLQKLMEDLLSQDNEVTALTLGTIARLNLKENRHGQEFLHGLYQRILPHLRHVSPEIVILARKARDHVENQCPEILQTHTDRGLPSDQELLAQDPLTRKAAITSWCEQNPEKLYSILMRQIRLERNPEVLVAVLQGLMQLRETGVALVAEVWLQSSHTGLQRQSAQCIAQYGSLEQQIQSLCPLLLSNDESLVQIASKCLTEISEARILQHIEDSIRSAQPALRSAGLDAARPFEGTAIRKLLGLICQDPSEANRIKLVGVLRFRSEAESTPLLRQLSMDPCIEVSELAMEGLRELESAPPRKLLDPSSLKTLEPIAESVPTEAETANMDAELQALDEQMDEQCHRLGWNILQGVRSKTLRGEDFHKQLFVLDKYEKQMQELLQKQEQTGLLRSVGKMVGAGVDLDLKVRELECKIEDAIIEIGYLAVELHQKEGKIFTTMMSQVQSILELFERRYQIENDNPDQKN